MPSLIFKMSILCHVMIFYRLYLLCGDEFSSSSWYTASLRVILYVNAKITFRLCEIIFDFYPRLSHMHMTNFVSKWPWSVQLAASSSHCNWYNLLQAMGVWWVGRREGGGGKICRQDGTCMSCLIHETVDTYLAITCWKGACNRVTRD